jgi:hypothetical protein
MAQAAATVATSPIQGISQPTRHPKLEDQAAIAALYVTKYDNAPKAGRDFLDNDNKLSSAGETSFSECADPNIPLLTNSDRRSSITQVRCCQRSSQLPFQRIKARRFRCRRGRESWMGKPKAFRALETRSLCFRLCGGGSCEGL